jgi:hypothetical protein
MCPGCEVQEANGAQLGGVEHGALRTSADVALRRDMLRHMTRHVPVGENLARWGKSQFQTHRRKLCHTIKWDIKA